MRILKDVYLKFKFDNDLLFSVMSGETGRGVRVHLEESTDNKEIKNFIKIEDKVFETEVSNIEDKTFDIVFPSLKEGFYFGEIQVLENKEVIKSGIYKIEVLESITSEEAEKLESIDSDSILMRLKDAEENLQNKINILDKAIEGKSGLSAYQIWLSKGNEGTEEDFLDSLKAKEKNYNFILDAEGNLFVDIY